MSKQQVKSSLKISTLNNAGLVAGALLMTGSLTASASILPTQVIRDSLVTTSAQIVSQATPPDVVIDTEPGGSGVPSPTPTNVDPRFTCQMVNGEYTVMYLPENQSGQAYPWAVPRQLGGGWTPERRCAEISRRLESYRPDGLLELTTGFENNYETICVTTQQVPGCRIVLTVPPGQSALDIRDRVFNNLLTADSGQQTQGVNTYNGDGRGTLGRIGELFNINLNGGGTSSRSPKRINLRPFLSPADGGTGAKLRQGNSTPANRGSSVPSDGRLNPDIFR